MAELSKVEVAEVTGLKRECVRIALVCQSCGDRFQVWQGTICGLIFGRHACPQCQAVHLLEVDEGCDIIDGSMRFLLADEAIAANESLTRLAESWHQLSPWKAALSYEGYDLGPPLEREISHHFMAHMSLKQQRIGP